MLQSSWTHPERTRDYDIRETLNVSPSLDTWKFPFKDYDYFSRTINNKEGESFSYVVQSNTAICNFSYPSFFRLVVCVCVGHAKPQILLFFFLFCNSHDLYRFRALFSTKTNTKRVYWPLQRLPSDFLKRVSKKQTFRSFLSTDKMAKFLSVVKITCTLQRRNLRRE